MIDVNFNFFSEVKPGQDPDAKSPIFLKYCTKRIDKL